MGEVNLQQFLDALANCQADSMKSPDQLQLVLETPQGDDFKIIGVWRSSDDTFTIDISKL